MDNPTLTRWKTLANDAVIASYGYDNEVSRLATALEQAVEELAFIADECDHCKTCENHGSHEDTSIPVDASEVLKVHGELKKRLVELKAYHVELSGKLAEWADTERFTEPLAEIIEQAESDIDELEATVIP